MGRYVGFPVFMLAVLLHIPEVSALEIIVNLPQKGNPIGHVAVRMRTFDEDREVVYDFGRYGKVWGKLRLQGEGILRVWRGPRAVQAYMERGTVFRRALGFVIEVSEQEERRILAFYEARLKEALWSRPGRGHSKYRLPRDYDGVTMQCAAFALLGLRTIWPRERWERVLAPRFNRGRGLGPESRAYYFETQKRLGLNEVMLPLDLIAAMRHARAACPEDIKNIRWYARKDGRFPLARAYGGVQSPRKRDLWR